MSYAVLPASLVIAACERSQKSPLNPFVIPAHDDLRPEAALTRLILLARAAMHSDQLVHVSAEDFVLFAAAYLD